ncbi:MAG: ferrous iron transport protein A [Tissierellia bacterium]|nr:ferrous iron transport protein A [Tissierellia bacterium]
MPLAEGRKLSIYRIEDLPDSHLLKVLGIRKGTQFIIQSKQPFKGPIVVKVGNRSIAIDYDIAKKIEVEEVA